MANFLATLQQFGVEVRDACRSHFSFPHQLDHLGPGVLDWCSGFIRPMKLIEVDAFNTQPAKRCFAFAPYGVGLEHATRFCHGLLALLDEAALCQHIWPTGRAQTAQQTPYTLSR